VLHLHIELLHSNMSVSLVMFHVHTCVLPGFRCLKNPHASTVITGSTRVEQVRLAATAAAAAC
jgi:hypothetical protein